MKWKTRFLQVVVFLSGIPVFAVAVLGVLGIVKENAPEHYPAFWAYVGLISMAVAAIPFFIAWCQAFKLLSYINQNQAFSERTVQALQQMKRCAITMSALYAVCLPFCYYVVQDADPPVGGLWLIMTLAPVVVAVIASVLEKLCRSAMEQGMTMKWETRFLQVLVFLSGIPVFAVGVLGVLGIVKENAPEHYSAFWVYVGLISMAAAAIPFFIAWCQAFKLLSYINQHQAFSERTVQALQQMKRCAITMSALYAVCLPFCYYVAQEEDAPGVILVGLFLTGVPVVVAVIASVLQKLCRSVMDRLG